VGVAGSNPVVRSRKTASYQRQCGGPEPGPLLWADPPTKANEASAGLPSKGPTRTPQYGHAGDPDRAPELGSPSGERPPPSGEPWQVERVRTPGANPFVVGEGTIWVAGSSSGDGRADARCSAWIPPPDASGERPTSGTCMRTSFSRSGPCGTKLERACLFYSCGMGGDSTAADPRVPGRVQPRQARPVDLADDRGHAPSRSVQDRGGLRVGVGERMGDRGRHRTS